MRRDKRQRPAARGSIAARHAVANAAVVILLSGNTCHGVFELPSSQPGIPSYCTMFHHMVKSGGTTIRNQLINASGAEQVPHPGLCVIGENASEDCIDALYNSAVIAGYVELLRKPMEEAGRHCEYFTVMRHPIDRLVSAFYYCPGTPDHQERPREWCGQESHEDSTTSRLLAFAIGDWKCKAMYQMNFSEYCPPAAMCEASVKKKSPTSLRGGTDWHRLEVAEEMLLKYTAVGIFEERELTMKLFDATVRSPVREWSTQEHANPGHRSVEREKVLAWAYESPDIRRVLAGDLLLYDMAFAIFRRQTSEALGTVW